MQERSSQEVRRDGRAAEDIPPALLSVTEVIIGSAITVHRALGPGFIESVYGNALAIELATNHLRFERERSLPVFYAGEQVGIGRADFIVDDLIVVELKATDGISDIHQAQVISYLKATQLPLGLILNFNVVRMTDGIRRCINSCLPPRPSHPSKPPVN